MKVGKYYYKNLWGWVEHRILRRPPIKIKKKMDIEPLQVSRFIFRAHHPDAMAHIHKKLDEIREKHHGE